MMLEIRPIQDGDMEFVRANPFEEQVKYYPQLIPSPDSYTCIFDGEIVAVGGIIDYAWPGVGECWLMLTKQARKHDVFGLIAYSAIEKKMNQLIEEHKLWRAEAMARVDFPQAIKFIESLGFEYEGTKRQYTPDKCDMRFYAKLFEVSNESI